MKKKIGIAAGVLIVLGLFIYTTAMDNATTVEINKSWELAEQQIKELSFVGMDQDVKVTIEEGTNEKTTIQMSGKVSEKAKEFLEKTAISKNQLKVTFDEEKGAKLFMTSNGKDPLDIVIRLGKDVSVGTFKIDSKLGNVVVKVPETFDGKYQLKAHQSGKIKAVPTTTKTMNSVLKVDTMGNIDVSK